MADNKQNSSGRYYQIVEGAYVYPLPPAVRRISHGKWGTATRSSNAPRTIIKPALKKKR